jgi:hypothetical protein
MKLIYFNEFRTLFSILLIGLVFFLSGCASLEANYLPENLPEVQTLKQNGSNSSDEVTATQADEMEKRVSKEESVEATLEVEIKVGLIATDPATVELVSGKFQFIEFFAFW